MTSYDATCESSFSNILSAIPENQGQTTDPTEVSTLETGIYSGKGGGRTYALQTTFTPGDEVVIRARETGDGWVEVAVVDSGTGVSPAAAEQLFTPFHIDSSRQVWQH